MKIYGIWKDIGEYEDRNIWVHCAFKEERDAKEYKRRMEVNQKTIIDLAKQIVSIKMLDKTEDWGRLSEVIWDSQNERKVNDALWIAIQAFWINPGYGDDFEYESPGPAHIFIMPIELRNSLEPWDLSEKDKKITKSVDNRMWKKRR